jgi:predicted transcriptional regulator
MKMLLYCVKAKPMLRDYRGKAIYNRFVISPNDRPFTSDDTQPILNGKIVAECDFEVDKLTNCGTSFMIMKYDDLQESYRYTNKVARGSCLDYTDLRRYLGTNDGYAIHIKNLHIFDKPIDIRNYYNIAPRTMQDCMNQRTLVKAPQNMCNAYDVYKNHYIVISIQPQWLCKILNGEKTIEVRKKVLKGMIK